MQSRLIFGLGAGQCGTQLLTDILKSQKNTHITHEEPPFLSWDSHPKLVTQGKHPEPVPGIRERIERMRRTRPQHAVVGDVAHFYLPYIDEMIALEPEVRILCLIRPELEIVDSFCRFLDSTSPRPVNHWSRCLPQDWYDDPIWSPTFPKYDIEDREEALKMYWYEYYSRAETFAEHYPHNFRIIDTGILTYETGVREVLSFAGFPLEAQVIVTGQKNTDDVEKLPPRISPVPFWQTLKQNRSPAQCVILAPFLGYIHQECDAALKELERRGYPVRRVGGYSAIDQGRNQMATDALHDGFEETLWIDSDISFHPDAVEMLRSHELPIVAGVYPQKGRRALASHIIPGTPSMTFGKEGCLVEMLYAGTGFLLVRREVYLTLQRELNLPVCNERFGQPMIPYFQPLIRAIDDGYWYLAEDYAFCHRARACGYRIMADTRIRLGHIGNYNFSWEDAGMERNRFASFTLRFGPGPGEQHENPVNVSPEQERIVRDSEPAENVIPPEEPPRNPATEPLRELAKLTPHEELLQEYGDDHPA